MSEYRDIDELEETIYRLRAWYNKARWMNWPNYVLTNILLEEYRARLRLRRMLEEASEMEQVEWPVKNPPFVTRKR